MARTLRLVPYDPAWPDRFAAESVRLQAAVGSRVIVIEHVGSTAVPGLPGKPVLDIGIAVASEMDADACIVPITALGYEYRGAHGDDSRRRYYVRNADGARAVQIHLCMLPAVAWDDHLAFRDALRSDAVLRAAYEAEKVRVATAVDWDKGAYAVAKGPFVARVLAALLAGQPPVAALVGDAPGAAGPHSHGRAVTNEEGSACRPEFADPSSSEPERPRTFRRGTTT